MRIQITESEVPVATDDPDDPCCPLITLSVLDVPISAQSHCGGREVHLLLGGATVILLADQVKAVIAALRGTDVSL